MVRNLIEPLPTCFIPADLFVCVCVCARGRVCVHAGVCVYMCR